MKKIPTLFARDLTTFRVVNIVHVDAFWVAQGEGTATRKFDGTACLVSDGRLYKRFQPKPGTMPPSKFIPLEAPEDGAYGPGWLPVGDGPEDQWHREAWTNVGGWMPDASYELVGPKVQKNVENYAMHVLVKHGLYPLPDVPREFEALGEYLATHAIEGVVWHHDDGRMVKIKGTDYGHKRADVQARVNARGPRG